MNWTTLGNEFACSNGVDDLVLTSGTDTYRVSPPGKDKFISVSHGDSTFSIGMNHTISFEGRPDANILLFCGWIFNGILTLIFGFTGNILIAEIDVKLPVLSVKFTTAHKPGDNTTYPLTDFQEQVLSMHGIATELLQGGEVHNCLDLGHIGYNFKARGYRRGDYIFPVISIDEVTVVGKVPSRGGESAFCILEEIPTRLEQSRIPILEDHGIYVVISGVFEDFLDLHYDRNERKQRHRAQYTVFEMNDNLYLEELFTFETDAFVDFLELNDDGEIIEVPRPNACPRVFRDPGMRQPRKITISWETTSFSITSFYDATR